MPFFPPTFSWNCCYRQHQDVKGLLDGQKWWIKIHPRTEKVCLTLGIDSQQVRGGEWWHRSAAITDSYSRDSNTFRGQRRPGVFWRLHGKPGTKSRVWHLLWWNCQWLQTPLTCNSKDNLHELKTCPQESCLAALCSYCWRSMTLTGQIFCFVLSGLDWFFVHCWDQINYFPLQPSDQSNSNGAESRNSDKRRDNVFFTVIFALSMIKKEWRLK